VERATGPPAGFLVGLQLVDVVMKKSARTLPQVELQARVRMICEREDESPHYVASEYWTIDAEREHSPAKISRAKWSSSKQEIGAQFSLTRGAGS